MSKVFRLLSYIKRCEVNRVFLIAIFLFIFTSFMSLNAQWLKGYGEGRPSSIQQTSDGGYIVAGGRSWSRLIWIIKLSSNGDIEWQRTYGGNNASSIQETSDGGYVVTGSTHFYGAEDVDGWFFKLDSAGDIEWQKTYGEDDADFDIASSIRETSDGGYIVAGKFGHVGLGEWGGVPVDNIRILKLFSDGDIHTYCKYISSSDATITDTDISPEVSYLSYQNTNVIPLDTDFPVRLRSENKTAYTICPESTLDDEDDDSGKKCFIATAAYGSPLHPYVETLRDFRDRYFVSNKLGSKFVDLYYKYSPSVANTIARSKPLKVIVRIHLVPIIILSYSMVHLGPIITGVIIIFVFMLPFFFVMFNRRKINTGQINNSQ